MRTLITAKNGAFQPGLPETELGAALADPATTVWLDIQDPAETDIALLRETFGFHPLAIEDATRSHERPKLDIFDTYYLIIFYVSDYDAAATRIHVRPVNIFLGANYLVTVHSGPIRPIADTLARWQNPNRPLGQRVSSLAHALLDAIVDDYFPIMDHIADRVEELENAIFVEYDEDAIQLIFGLKRDLLALRHVLAPERDVMNTLLRRQLSILKPKDLVYFQDIYDHIVRVTESIDTYRDLLSSALDSYLSLQSNNLNQIMKVLTMASIILMTGALIAGIYGMNFRYMPELAWRWGYPLSLAVMALTGGGLFIYFRRKKWW